MNPSESTILRPPPSRFSDFDALASTRCYPDSSGTSTTAGGPSEIEPARVAQAELANIGSLSTSARLSMWILASGHRPGYFAEIQSLMKEYGWTSLRALRHCRGYTRTEMALRVGMNLPTYGLIEDGTVDLGSWVQPAVELLLLDDANVVSRPQRPKNAAPKH